MNFVGFLGDETEPFLDGSLRDVGTIKREQKSQKDGVTTGSIGGEVLVLSPEHFFKEAFRPPGSKLKGSIGRELSGEELTIGNNCLRLTEEDRIVFPGSSLDKLIVSLVCFSIG